MINRDIFEIFTKLETKEEAERFLKDLLTDKELEEVKKRWELVKALYEGKPQRKVRDDIGVSIATVTRGSHMLKHGSGGFKAMLEKEEVNFSHAEKHIDSMRNQIDSIDNQILELLGKRMGLMPYIAQFKKDRNMHLTQRGREEKSIMEKKLKAKKLGINPDFVDLIFSDIFHEAKNLQIPNLLSHTLENLKKLYKKYGKTTVPVFVKIKTDTETPISLYKRYTKDQCYSFILESVGENNEFSKYSFIGTKPKKILSFKEGSCAVMENQEDRVKIIKYTNPLDVLRKEICDRKIIEKNSLPRFLGGAVGFLSYDNISYFENSVIQQTEKSIDIPEAIYGIYDELAVFDHTEDTIIFVKLVDLNDELDLFYPSVVKYFAEVLSTLEGQVKMDPLSTNIEKIDIPYESNMSKEDFLDLISKAKKDIVEGEIFQLVLSQQFKLESRSSGFDLYRSLRQVNPSSYLFYLNYPDFSIIGASPETFVKVEDGEIKMRALAGTSVRGKDKEQDLLFEKQLLSDEKECAEHMMLVDLARNDVGKISKIGTCEVERLMHVTRSSYVMHIATDIKGIVDEKYDALDVLKSCFPRGTLSGAPKVRAMELIAKYEKYRRNIYGGAVHYLDYSGNLDAAIGIRTMLKKGNEVFVQAGCGIVHDSVPEKEYEETKNKAKGVLKAISQAQQYQL